MTDQDRWVNAVVEFVFPLDDVPVTATPKEKAEAAFNAVDETAAILIDRHGAVVTTTYEDAPASPTDHPFTDEDRARVDALLQVIRDDLHYDPQGQANADSLTRALAYIDRLEEALEPFARVLADVLPSTEERTDLENHGFDPDEGIPHDLGRDAPTVGDYRRAARALDPPPTEQEEA